MASVDNNSNGNDFPIKKLALVSHDNKKPLMMAFAKKYKKVLDRVPQIVATGTTGGKLINEVGLTNVKCFASGPLGGDQEIGAAMVHGEIEAVIFFRDPLTSHPHEPDVAALGRLADVHNVPLASCLASAEIMIVHLANKLGITDLEKDETHSPQVQKMQNQHSEQFGLVTEVYA